MPSSIENKVVSIKFDNASFASKIAGTLKGLDKLKGSLAMPDAGKGLSDVSKAAGSFNMGAMSASVDGVSAKFLALSTIAITALSKITSKALDTAGDLVKMFTITPITEGFAEYELKMGAIQTIMAGSGESLEVVNGHLEDLNRYSDETIYSFADMTQNIGKFTNAGVGLEQSVNAIKGVANVAAISGANAQQASAAMYNFAQALSAGSVKLIDWKSIENAGLATEGFKTQLLDSAVAAGTLTGGVDGMYQTLAGTPLTATKGFNEALTEQFLTTDVLVGTLEEYADASTEIGAAATAAASDVKTFSQLMDTLKEAAGSGWAASSEIVFGDFNEAKVLFTTLSDALGGLIGDSAEARNKVLQDWKDLGGRDLLIQGLTDAVKGLSTIIAPIKDAFREMFPRKTGADLYSLTERFAAFTKRIAVTGGTADKIKRIFKGFFAILAIGKEIVVQVFNVFKKFFGLFNLGQSGSILSFFAKLGDGVVALKENLVDGGGIATFFDKVSKSIAKFVKATKNFIAGPFVDKIIEFKDAIVGLVEGIDFSPITNFFDRVKNFDLGNITSSLGDFGSTLGGIGSAIGGAGSDAGGLLKAGGSKAVDGATKSFEGLRSVWEGLGKVLNKIGEGFSKFMFHLKGALGVTGSFVDAIKDELSKIGGALGDVLTTGSFEPVLKVIGAGLFGGLLVLIRNFLKNGISLDFGGGFMDEAKKSLKGVTGVLTAMQTNIKADTLMKIAIALGVLTASIVVLSFIDADQLAKAMTAITVGFAQLATAMAVLEKISTGPKAAANLALVAGGLILLGGALLIFGLATKLMSTMDWGELSRGMTGLTILLGVMISQVNVLDTQKGGLIKAGIGITGIAIGLLIMAAALKLMATMGWEEMARGLTAITVSLGLIIGTMRGLGDHTQLIKVGIGIGAIAVGLLLLAVAIKIFSTFDIEEVARGLGGIGASLAVMIYAMNRANEKKMLGLGAAILLVSAGMVLMAKAVSVMAELGWMEMIRGVTGIGVVLLVLAIAMNAMKASIGGAVAMFLVSKGLDRLAGALDAFATVPLEGIGKGLLAMVGIFGILTAAGYVLAPVAVVLAVVGAGIFLLGAGFALAGTGALQFARALQIFSKVGGAAIKGFMKFLDALLEKLPAMAKAAGEAVGLFAIAWVSSWPTLLKIVGELLEQLLDLIIKLTPKAVTAIIGLIDGLLTAIITLTPKIVEAGYTILLALLGGLRDNIEEIATLGAEIIVKFLGVLTDNIEDLVTAGVELLAAFISGVADNLDDIAEPVGELIVAFIEAVASLADDIIAAGFQALKKFLLGFSENLGVIIDTVGQVIKQFGEDVVSFVDDLLETGVYVLTQLLLGIASAVGDILATISLVIDQIGDDFASSGIVSSLLGFGLKILNEIMQGMVDAVGDILDYLTQIVEQIATDMVTFVTRLGEIGVQMLTDILDGMLGNVILLANKLGQMMVDFLVALREAVDLYAPQIRAEGVRLGWAIVDGMTLGLADKAAGFISDAGDLAWDAFKAIAAPWDSDSPSKSMIKLGKAINQGLVIGLNDDSKTQKSAANLGNSTFGVLQKALSQIPDALENMDDLNPTITPVLDLTGVQKDAKALNGMFPNSMLSAANALNQASLISYTYETDRASAAEDSGASTPTEVSFEQNIYSPTALSTNDIYRGTRGQIVLAKEELSIPS